MGLGEQIGTSQPFEPRFGFREFSRQPEYRAVNRQLLEHVLPYIRDGFFHIDVATGTGLVPQEMIKLARERGIRGRIIGIDPNRASLAYAREDTPKSPFVTVEFMEGFGQDIQTLVGGKIPKEGVHYASIHDAIHEIPGEDQKRAVLGAMASTLRPGGVLSLNSAFTNAQSSGDILWGKWKMLAHGLLGKKRDRSVVALEAHSPQEYADMVGDQGLHIVHAEIRTIPMTKQALLAISQYPEFIKGVFRDMIDEASFSLEQKRDALQRALESLGAVTFQRVWFDLMAQKPAS